jgi:PTH1 family peptidyl-tRNA hydrolase
MKVLVGLGNPGEKYKHTRHNIGFTIVDKIAEEYSQTTWVKKFNGKFCQCWSEGEKFLLLKPETFMNNSGQSVTGIITFFKLSVNDIIVLHDDLDLKVGQIKIKHKGGHAGHNGIRSIHQAIGDKYTRVRIGVGHPGDKTKVSSYVLSDFSKSDTIQMEHFIKDCVSGINALISNDYSRFLRTVTSQETPSLKNTVQRSETTQSKSPTQHNPPNLKSNHHGFSVLKRIIKKLT